MSNKVKAPSWHGTFLSEDEIVADMVTKIKADQVALACWRDPISWKMPYAKADPLEDTRPLHYGCLWHVDRSIRNWYGLWQDKNPYVKVVDCEIKDGVVVDPLHPDNVSARILERVKAVVCDSSSKA